MTIAIPNHTHTNRKHIRVVSAGKFALESLKSSQKWQIIAVFRSCFYCENDTGNIVCIAGQSVDRGPFTLNCTQEEYTLLPGCKEGDYIHVEESIFYLKGSCIEFDLEEVSQWHCPLGSRLAITPKLKEDMKILGVIARHKAPPESLGALISVILYPDTSEVPTLPDIFTAAIHNQVLDSIQSIRRILAGIDIENAILSECTKLIGLGRGLTPSGDDFIAGMIMAFYNQGRVVEAQSLAKKFHHQAIDRTSSISIAFYRALADGFAVESFTKFVADFGQGISENFSPLHRICNFGATSGWDFLAGFAFGLTILSHLAERRGSC